MDGIVRCNLRRLRKAKGYSLNQIELMTGINRGTLSKYEQDEVNMTIVSAVKLAIVLDCTLDDLFTYKSAGEA